MVKILKGNPASNALMASIQLHQPCINPVGRSVAPVWERRAKMTGLATALNTPYRLFEEVDGTQDTVNWYRFIDMLTDSDKQDDLKRSCQDLIHRRSSASSSGGSSTRTR